MNRVFLLIFLAGSFAPVVRGQEEIHQQLNTVAVQEQKGEYDQAIFTLRSLIETGTAASSEIGRCWTLLGIALEQQGQFSQSQSAYENAIRLLESDKQRLDQYASALDSFASLNSIEQHPEIANKMWAKAIGIHKQLEDHRATAREYTFLAGIEIQKKHLGPARKALENAVSESKLIGNLTADDSIFRSDTEAWLANVKGDSQSELAAYLHSLELRKNSQGESLPLTGWAYLFAGNAYANNKAWTEALASMREGLHILERTVGRENPQYLAGESLYAKVLDRYGRHEEASTLKHQVEQGMSGIYRGQCVGCTLSVASLR